MRIRKSKARCSDQVIVDAYKSGLSLTKISKIYPISLSGAWKVLRMYPIKIRPPIKGERNARRILSDNRELQICNDYKSGMLQKDVANKYGVNQVLVSRILARHGYKARLNRETGKVEHFAPRWRGGISYDEKGYKRLYLPNYKYANKGGLVKEHRLIMEKVIGRKLGIDEVVHHKNGIKTDNSMDNLEVMTRSEHTKLHNKTYSREKRGL